MSEISNILWLRLKQFPTPIGGLALAIASLGLLMETRLPSGGLIQTVTALIAAAMLSTLAARFVLHPRSLMEDLKHPVVGSVAPTFAMGTMVVSNALVQHHHEGLGHALWLGAVILHLIFLAAFLRHRFARMRMDHLVPSWFVPPVGIAVAAVSYAGTDSGMLYNIALICLYFALAAYAGLLPVMVYRLIFGDTIPEAAQPTIALLAAPPSLSLAAYLSVDPDPNILVVMTLYGIAILMTFTVYVAFLRLLALPFSPGYAAFTFPMSISATAQFKVAAQLEAWGARPEVVGHILWVGQLEMVMATLIITYVSLRYALFLARRPALS